MAVYCRGRLRLGLFASPVEYGAGSKPFSVSSCDLDGDGDLDLATANYNSNNVSVLLNNDDGIFVPLLASAAGVYGPRHISIPAITGAAFGLALYQVNFFIFAGIFLWFAMARNWVSAMSHIIFGIVAAMLYVVFSRTRGKTIWRNSPSNDKAASDSRKLITRSGFLIAT